MLRLRFLFAWLLMAAVPLQGFAAASMLFCGKGAQHMQVAAQGATATASSQQHAHTQHASVAHDHRAMHSHASGDARGLATAPSDALGASSDGIHGAFSDASQGASPDAGHTCSVCAACCNGVALLAQEPLIAMAPAPQSALAEPFVLIHTRPSPVPDKPPRA